MTPTTATLERNLLKLQLSDSKKPCHLQPGWVPAKRTLGRPACILARPSPAGAYNQFFGFPVSLKDLENLGNIAFSHIRPGEEPPDCLFTTENAPNLIKASLSLPVCEVQRGQLNGDIPEECRAGRTSVMLLVVWKAADDDDTCPTPGQVRTLERKIGRPPRWWVDHHPPGYWDD
ncbi:hypothetical protein M405DRAFT_816144, partial [Rhizopogon salebrosus TDB-379]